MNFSSITLQFPESNLQIIPVNLYKVNTVRNRYYYVVIYNFILNYKGRIITSQIPYYVSDGHTNKFRANILYPFLCFKDNNSIDFCPYSPNHTILAEGGLIKLKIPNNFKIKKLEEWIENKFINKFWLWLLHKRGINHPNNKIGIIIYRELINNSQRKTRGLPSVLPRLTNILDFIIAVLSPNLGYDLRHYRPITDENFKYDMTYSEPEFFEPNLAEDFYRLKLLNIFNDFKNNLQKVNSYYQTRIIDNIDTVRLDFVEITMRQFNTLYAICNKTQNLENTRTKKGILKNTQITNFQNFAEISKIISYELYNYTRNILYYLKDNNEEYTKEYKIYNIINSSIILTGDNYNILENTIGFETKCPNPLLYAGKYLKYKKKYLELKNKLNK